ncbi:probable protein S-acyltransferase 22 [Olea europaea var. sylvestris]|uniref:probable protein S-acyltransferase 22 n=1 Tax=Olea europaea var. sylvestris TaxID=158386 RepID=UPI000C1D1F2E|nr:probable protein S-acyltransferase 22 [Olea europaea var. sylvestris]XP_022878147.1 probable protein S-acyltransferase 22 [Olea europaea var. sylvestris]XP_022878148.1 probable protein S-acyltransferase 22 [Olea europaea var. sylvestris]
MVAVSTTLAMIATLPLAQLSFFHILLIKKGISTYNYIIALREQEQEGVVGQQSPQMSMASSLTGLSSASSFNTFHRAAWCTPPRLFVEDHVYLMLPYFFEGVEFIFSLMCILYNSLVYPSVSPINHSLSFLLIIVYDWVKFFNI